MWGFIQPENKSWAQEKKLLNKTSIFMSNCEPKFRLWRYFRKPEIVCEMRVSCNIQSRI